MCRYLLKLGSVPPGKLSVEAFILESQPQWVVRSGSVSQTPSALHKRDCFSTLFVLLLRSLSCCYRQWLIRA